MYWVRISSLDVNEAPNLGVHVTQILGQDEHQIWGPSSITIGETASSNVLEDFGNCGGRRAGQLTEKSNDQVKNSVVIHMWLAYGAFVWPTQQRYAGTETSAKTLKGFPRQCEKIVWD